MSRITTLLQASKAVAATLLLGACVTAANAGFVTLHVAELQQIYDQARVQIRYNATQTIYNTALLSIDTDEEFNALSLYEAGGQTLSMFFVDSINFCGAAVPGIVGCGSTPGTLIALDSNFMLQPEAPTAMGHEIGHNLGLEHQEPVDPDVGDNLMNPGTYVGNPAPLTDAQIAQILTSDLIQLDGNQRFLSITPFAVLAEIGEVPEPGSLALVGLAMGMLAWGSRRARRH